MITEEILNILACPICKGYPLELEIWAQKDNVIIKGEINCPSCGRKYFVNDGIPCMLPDKLEKQELKSNFRKWSKKQSAFLKWLNVWESIDPSNRLKIETNERLQRFFKLYQPKGSILDIGSGRGEIRQYLIENDYFGVDPENFILDGLVKEIDFPFVQSFGEYLPFRDGVFDNILILAVLDHVINPTLVLEESFRVLKKSGHIFILNSWERGTLAKKGIRTILKGNICGLIKGLFSCIIGDTHLHHFTASDIIKLVSCYFEKIETKKDSEEVLFIRGQK